MDFIKSKVLDIEVPKASPFENDALKREPFAQMMTHIVDMYGGNGCVLSLNGGWGTGKTTFIRMWKQKLDNEHYRTVYFNAWKYDYTDDPLIAIISELKAISKDERIFKSIASCAGKISWSILTAVTKGIIVNKLGIQTDDIAEAITKTVDTIGQDQIKAFEDQKQTLDDFKKHLQKFVTQDENDKDESSNIDGCKPVVFFIDELDRCNPTYAVRTLEIVKHLFDVPNIVFVLSINKQQLSYAIKGYYGSSNMDAMGYLKRFIDIEIDLPECEMGEFCNYLYDYYGFRDFFESTERKQYFQHNGETRSFVDAASKLSGHKHLSLRSVEKIFAQCRLSLTDFKSNTYVVPDVFFYLCLLRSTNPEMYEKIRKRAYTNQELMTAIERDIPNSLLSQREEDNNNYSGDARFINFMIAGLLYLYVFFDGWKGGELPWKRNSEKDNQSVEMTLDCKVCDVKGVNEALSWYVNRHLNIGLKSILDRIELLRTIDFNR